jgi:hypothetical protein
MPTAYSQAVNRNEAEKDRLYGLIESLKFINNYHNASNSNNWLSYWENNNGHGLSEEQIARIQNANRARKANPENYTINKIQKKIDNIRRKMYSRQVLYGYMLKPGKNWVRKKGVPVPYHLPNWEAEKFGRVRKPGTLTKSGQLVIMGQNFPTGKWRNAFTAEGTLKPASGKRPVGFKAERTNIPSLKELAWKATPMANMTNEQIKFMTQFSPMNLTLLKPKKFTVPPSITNIAKQRNAAARKIQRVARKYLSRKAPQRGQGPTPRSPATRARQTNLGIMGGARRSPGAANNTRITWSRNANGKISIHKTLRNLNLSIPQTMKNLLENMPENRAMNVIRQMARQR